MTMGHITEEERSSAVSDEHHRNDTSRTTVGDGLFIDHNSHDHSPMFPIPENTHNLADLTVMNPPDLFTTSDHQKSPILSL